MSQVRSMRYSGFYRSCIRQEGAGRGTAASRRVLQHHAHALPPFIFGITAPWRRRTRHCGVTLTSNTINSVKAGLMGLWAGIGDSVFWGTLRPLAGGIACSLALTGNLFAPSRSHAVQHPNVLVRYFGCHWGYNSGMKALNCFEELGLTGRSLPQRPSLVRWSSAVCRPPWSASTRSLPLQRRQRHQADRMSSTHHAQ